MVIEDMDEVVLSQTLAERELSAFVTAVTELFGSEQAEASAEEWFRELMASDDFPATTREWRTVTITAAAKLAIRVDASAYQQRRRAYSST